jgi:hypothetical protein
MPFKANADRRHRIPKQRRQITNWAEYDAALRQRGSLTVSGLAIAMALTLPCRNHTGSVHHTPLQPVNLSSRKTDGW